MQDEITARPLVDILSEQLGEQVVMSGDNYVLLSDKSAVAAAAVELALATQEDNLLEQAKAEKLLQIEADFNLAESQSVSYLGFEFVGGQDSVKSIDDYYRLMLLAGQTSFTIWDTNKEDHVLTEAEVKGLVIAIGSVSSANQFNLKNRKVALANIALSDVEPVVTLDDALSAVEAV